MKSATENVGTFDAENPDIRYDLTDEEARKATEWERAQMDKARAVLRAVFTLP